ncbi:MAG: hypothetical protein ACRD5G_15180 [Candidatus Acidiferrales bacterium]
MDRILRRQLDAIARDRMSGAAELALQATKSLRSWLEREPKPNRQRYFSVAKSLLEIQPAMAPFLRLANEALRAGASSAPERNLALTLRDFEHRLLMAPTQISVLFCKTLRSMFPGRRTLVTTYSYSSTVVTALIHARSKILNVKCSEGRPLFEGRRLARELSSAGLAVSFTTDARLMESFYSGYQDVVVIGADSVTPFGFTNKTGTAALLEMATQAGVRTLILADSTKLLPGPLAEFQRIKEDPPARQVWPSPPRGVSISNVYFGGSPYPRRCLVITEKGVTKWAGLDRLWRPIAVSGRLKELLDVLVQNDW